jgi:hypothetical protein
MTSARTLAVLAIGALAACAEPNIPVAPTAEVAVPLVAREGGLGFNAVAAEGGDTYLVRFKESGIPKNFAGSVAKLGGAVIFAHAGVGLAAVSGIDAASAAVLAARRDVAAVDPDMFTLIDDPTDMTVESVDAPASPSAPNTAFFFARQWHLRAINAQAAWAAGRLGVPATKVGILDTGLGYVHADLAGRVDLVNSVSFLSAAENARVEAAFPGAHPVADLHYHGTHVGATVASNALAAAGVTSGATLVGIKVCSPGVAVPPPPPVTVPPTPPTPPWTASCPTNAVLFGILYAADLGLDVINLSLGGNFQRRDGSAKGGFGPSFIATINSVFNYANKKGTTVVVAAGNSAINFDTDGNNYGAYCNAPHVVCVSATGPTAATNATNGPWQNVDALAAYSNFGATAITVAAPGGTGRGPVWAACSSFSLALAVCQTGTFIVGITGTSMAAPHAAGVAALIAGDVGHKPSAIRARLIGTSDDLGPLGIDPAYGNGRINAARAVGLN